LGQPEGSARIGEEIETLQRGGQSLDGIAILVRASFQMREFEERFIVLGLPYKVIGGPRFYERADPRRARYLRCVRSPTTISPSKRIFNVPKRGLGDAYVSFFHDYPAARRVVDAAMRVLIETEELKARPRQILRELARSFDGWRRGSTRPPMTNWRSSFWRKAAISTCEGRPHARCGRTMENLKELTRSMEESPSLAAFLEHVRWLPTPRAATQASGSRSYLHAAKGLEFDVVILPGGRGMFPTSDPWTRTAGQDSKRSGASLMCGLTRARRQAKSTCRQSPHPRAVADDGALAIHRRIAGGSCRGGRGVGRFGAMEAMAFSRFDRAEPFSSTYQTPGCDAREKFEGRRLRRAAAARGGARDRAVIRRPGDREIQRRIGARQRRAGSFTSNLARGAWSRSTGSS